MNIKHIVVDINDFLVVASMKNGAVHMASNGGCLLMLQGISKEEKFLLLSEEDIA